MIPGIECEKLYQVEIYPSIRVADPLYFDADPDPWIRIKNMDPDADPAPDPTL